MTTLTEIRKRLDWLIDRTFLLAGDPGKEKYAESRIIEAINDACMWLAMETELIKDEINIQVIQEVWYYDVAERVEEDATKRPFGYPVRIGFDGNESPGLVATTTQRMDLSGVLMSDEGNPSNWRLDLLSYGQIALDPIPMDDGTALPSESGNIQVAYVGMPNPMEDKNADYPDSKIPSHRHELIPYFAAKLLLDEGGMEDMALGERYEMRWSSGIRETVSDTYNQTSYHDVKPM